MWINRRTPLKQWAHFMRDRDKLDQDNRTAAGAFFAALKRTPQEDVDFLAAKYLHGKPYKPSEWDGLSYGDKPVPDATLGTELGLTTTQYWSKRKQVEARLHAKYLEELDALLAKRADRLAEFYLMLNGEYLVKVEYLYPYTRIITTHNRDKATVFTPETTPDARGHSDYHRQAVDED